MLLEPTSDSRKPFISLLAGSNIFENENWNSKDILERNRIQLNQFKIRKQKYHIYD